MPELTIKEQLYSFATLPKDWDEFNSLAIHLCIVEDAIAIVDAVEKIGGQIKWALPTTDETILMEFILGHKKFKIETDLDQRMGVVIWEDYREPTFHDYEVKEFIEALPNL